jgi:hypothetical protein
MWIPRIGVAYVSDRGDLHLPHCQASVRDFVLPGLVGCLLETDVVVHTINDEAHELGMAGAAQAAWTWAIAQDVDFLLHVEEDFRFVTPIDVIGMAAVLRRSPYLAQMCLKRQPWSPEERAAGDLTATDPGAYSQRVGFFVHRRLFSLNPCLIPRRVLELGWPSGPLGVGNEAGFTRRCLDEGLSFGYWGNIGDPPRVEHVGDTRAEGWRL